MKQFHTRIVRCVILLAVIMASYALPSHAATTWYVSTNGTDSAGTLGMSWTDSFLTISNGLAHAESNDTVVVSNGTYTIDEQLVVDNAITLIGTNGADVTIVDAGGNDRCCYVAHPLAVVEGLTLRNGDAASATPEKKGGGVYITNGTVRACIITDNTGSEGGGAAIMYEGLLDRCEILNNSGGYGAGIRFENDTAATYTGGTARNCLIAQNSGSQGGGAFFYYGGQMDSCTVVSNYCSISWGGALATLRGNSTWRNTIVYFNTGSSGNPQNYYVNNGGVSYNLCTTPTRGTNCQTNDPLLRDLAGGDYRVRAGSPCIDNGQSNAWMAAAVDLDGNSRIDPESGKNDIGAYEYQLPTLDCGFSGTATEGFLGTLTTFTATVVGTDTNDVVYLWDFDNDGSPDLWGADKSVVSNAYGIGTYSVSLLVTNASGTRAAQTNLDYVTISPEMTYVSQEGAHVYPYTNWIMAATNIQPAIDVGMAGTTVWVSNGVYRLSEQVSVHEGILLRSVNGANKTTIHGNDAVCCVYLYADSLVEGMTLTRGGNSGAYLYYGGTLRDCLIVSNTITGAGAGVHINSGGLVERCQIISNTSIGDGGGFYAVDGGTMRNCLLQGNTCTRWGGGAYLQKGGTVQSCTIVGNTAGNGGGVTHNQGGKLWNCIVMENSSDSESNVYFYSASNVAYTDCCTTPSVAIYGSGNITDDPQFRGATNFRLATGSPCIDTGYIETWMNDDATDLEGYSRIHNDLVDMGAYEWQPPQGTVISIQ